MTTSATLTALASAARTTSSVASGVDVAEKRTARLTLDVTAASGATKTLAVSIETSEDNATGWRTLGTFTSTSAVGVETKRFPGADRYIRVRWTITGSGSPSFTFSVLGTAILVYASPDDMARLGIPTAATATVTSETIAHQLEAATDMIDGYLASQYTMPITAWGDDIRRAACVIAAFDCLTTRGATPDNADPWLLARYYQITGQPGQKGWLQQIAAGDIVPPGLVDTPPDVVDGGGVDVYTDNVRGW